MFLLARSNFLVERFSIECTCDGKRQTACTNVSPMFALNSKLNLSDTRITVSLAKQQHMILSLVKQNYLIVCIGLYGVVQGKQVLIDVYLQQYCY